MHLWCWSDSLEELCDRRQATTTLWPLWGSSQNESCCSDRQNKSLFQLGRTDSGASILINPVHRLVGEIMQPETTRWYQRFTRALKCPVTERGKLDDDEEKEGECGWQSLVQGAPASGITITQPCSARYLISPPFLSASASKHLICLLLFTILQTFISPLLYTNMQILHRPREKTENTYQCCILQCLPLHNIFPQTQFPKLISSQFSAHHHINPPLICFIFYVPCFLCFLSFYLRFS